MSGLERRNCRGRVGDEEGGKDEWREDMERSGVDEWKED